MSFILQESYFKKVKQGEMVYKRRWVVPSSGEKTQWVITILLSPMEGYSMTDHERQMRSSRQERKSINKS